MTKSHQKSDIYALAFVILIDTMTIGLVIPIFAALFNDANGILPAATSSSDRAMLYSLVISLPMFALLFGAPILGEMSDRLGRRTILLFSLLGVFFSCLLSVLSLSMNSVVLLFISRFCVSMMDGSQAIAQAAIVDISAPEDKVKNMSLMTFAAIMGFIIGPLLGGLLADKNLVSWFNYETPFWAAAILALANFFILRRLFKETFIPAKKSALSLTHIFIRLCKGFIDTRYWKLSLAFICSQFTWAGLFQSSTFMLAENFHYSAGKLGLFAAYIGLLFSIFLLGFIRIFLRYISVLNLARMGAFLLGNGLLWFSFAVGSELSIWLALIPTAAGMALSYNTLLALFSDAVGADEQGRIMGVTMGLVAIAWLFAGLYTGHFSAISYHLTYLGQAIVGFIGFGLLLLQRKA
jgi:MFS family permease